MSDLVDRLRRGAQMPIPPVMWLTEAADEIERLEKLVFVPGGIWRSMIDEALREPSLLESFKQTYEIGPALPK